MTRGELVEYAKNLIKKCPEILDIKGHDYAGDDAFKNFRNLSIIEVSIERGIMVQIVNKISRLYQLLKDAPSVKEETFEDTVVDLINYLIILSAKKNENTTKMHNSDVTVQS